MSETCPEPGVYEDVPFEKYLAWPAMNQSSLKAMRDSPAHFKGECEHPREATAAMKKGTLLDTLLFEGEDALQSLIVVRPEGHGNSKVVQKAKTDAELAGLIMVVPEDLDILRWRVDQLQKHSEVAELLKACTAQVSFVWDDPHTNIRCKGRADLAEKGGPRIADLKGTRNAADWSVARDIATFGYHVQGAMYTDGLSLATGVTYDEFVFILAEDKPPYCPKVVVLGKASIVAGRAAYSRWLWDYKSCLAKDEWPGYGPQGEALDIPYYALREEGIEPEMVNQPLA